LNTHLSCGPYFVRSLTAACSPKTIPNNPSRATMGGAGLFTRMSPYATPTSRPTANEMSSSFISSLLSRDDVYSFGDSCFAFHQSKLSTCFAFVCPAAIRLYASTAFSNGTISIGGGFKAPVSKPAWSSLAISAIWWSTSP